MFFNSECPLSEVLLYQHICTYLFLEEVVKSLHPHLTEQTEPLEREIQRRKRKKKKKREREVEKLVRLWREVLPDQEDRRT